MPSKTWTDVHRYETYQKNWKNGVLLNDVSNTSTFSSTATTVTSNVPDWKRAIRNGNNATGNMVASWDRLRIVPWFAGVVYTLESDTTPPIDVYADNRRSITGLTGTVPAFPSLVSIARRDAQSQLFSLAVGSRRKLQGGVIVGEIRETMAMLKRPAAEMFTSLTKLKDAYTGVLRYLGRRRRKRIKYTVGDANKLVRGAWLEHSYGWKPLLADTRDAAEALAEKHLHLSREVDFIRVQKDAEQAVMATSVNTVGQSRVVSNTEQRRIDRVKYLCALRGSTDSPLLRTMSELGFSPEDFIPTVYNLIPYSFVLDYFTNTGEVLDAWSHRSIRYHWCQETTISERWVKVTQTDRIDEWQHSLGHVLHGKTFIPGSYKRRVGSINRGTVDQSAVQPEFHFEIPGIRQTFNMVQLFDAFRHITESMTKLLR